MKTLRRLSVAVAIVLAATDASRSDDLVGKYLCNPIAAGGAAYVNGAWSGVSFTLPAPDIVSIEPGRAAGEYGVEITTAGELSVIPCGDGSVVPFEKVLSCPTFLGWWTINFHLMRFTYAYFGDYVYTNDDANSGTPMIVVGTCTRIAP